MLTNRSVPVDTVLPHLVYSNVATAIEWLSRAFGFTEHYRYGAPDSPSGAQLQLGRACIMLREARPGEATPSQAGAWTQSLTIFVDDVDTHFTRAKSAGATIVEEPHETMYGEYQFGVIDFEGHHWLFSRHAKNIAPADWGAHVNPSSR